MGESCPQMLGHFPGQEQLERLANEITWMLAILASNPGFPCSYRATHESCENWE